MAHNTSDLEAAPVDPGRPDLGTDPKEIYRNLGKEISSLPFTEKRDKVQDFLRRNADSRVDMQNLADQIGISSRTLYKWMAALRQAQTGMRQSAQVQPLVPAVAAQGMAPSVVHNAAHPSLMLGHARQPQTGLISSPATHRAPLARFPPKQIDDAWNPSQCDVRCGTAGGCFPCASIPPVCGAI